MTKKNICVVVNKHSTEELEGLEKRIVNAFLDEELPNVDFNDSPYIQSEDYNLQFLDKGIEELLNHFSSSQNYDLICIYGGDGTIMRMYNAILEVEKEVPPILILGGGSGSYWAHELKLIDKSLAQRVELAKRYLKREIYTISKPLLKFQPLSKDGSKIEWFDVVNQKTLTGEMYADNFCIGLLAKIVELGEKTKSNQCISSLNSPQERKYGIVRAYISGFIHNLKDLFDLRKYNIRLPINNTEECISIGGSVNRFIGGGINIYSPQPKSFSYRYIQRPDFNLATVLHYLFTGSFKDKLFGTEEKDAKLLEIILKGEVPIHLNAERFLSTPEKDTEYTINIEYLPDQLRFISPTKDERTGIGKSLFGITKSLFTFGWYTMKLYYLKVKRIFYREL